MSHILGRKEAPGLGVPGLKVRVNAGVWAYETRG